MRRQKLLAGTTLACGVTLEIFYYFIRFQAEGSGSAIALIQGISLTSFLLVVFSLRKRGPAAWLVIIPLLAYSIFTTSSGNRQNLVNKATEDTRSLNAGTITELQDKLNRKKEAYNDAFAMKSNSFDTVQEMAHWRSTVAGVDESLAEKEKEIDAIENQIIQLGRAGVEESSVSRIYDFYSRFIPGLTSDSLQVLLQTLLSAFIAMMAPAATMLWPKEEESTPVTVEESPHSVDWEYFVREWVHTNWTGIRNGQTRAILSKDKFIEFKTSRGIAFTHEVYDKIKTAAFTIKAVDNSGITEDNEEKAIKAILREVK